MRLKPHFPLFAVLLATSAHAAPEYIGAEKCGACHQVEYQDWRRSGHAAAYARLSKVQQRDATCRGCHSMVTSEADPSLTGVQCESCHGPGGLYAPRFVMKDKELAKLLGLQGITEETCNACHAKDAPSLGEFKFAEKVLLVNHKKSRELATAAPEKKTP